jgi:hypothetical protein
VQFVNFCITDADVLPVVLRQLLLQDHQEAPTMPPVFHSGIRPRGGGRSGVWGGADEPLPSMGYGAKPQKKFL